MEVYDTCTSLHGTLAGCRRVERSTHTHTSLISVPRCPLSLLFFVVGPLVICEWCDSLFVKKSFKFLAYYAAVQQGGQHTQLLCMCVVTVIMRSHHALCEKAGFPAPKIQHRHSLETVCVCMYLAVWWWGVQCAAMAFHSVGGRITKGRIYTFIHQRKYLPVHAIQSILYEKSCKLPRRQRTCSFVKYTKLSWYLLFSVTISSRYRYGITCTEGVISSSHQRRNIQ